MFEAYWYGSAHRHLDQADAGRVIQLCEVSSVLTPESIAVRDELDDGLLRRYFPETIELVSRPLARQVYYAMVMGRILILRELQDKREVTITDALLDETFRRVCRALEI